SRRRPERRRSSNQSAWRSRMSPRQGSSTISPRALLPERRSAGGNSKTATPEGGRVHPRGGKAPQDPQYGTLFLIEFNDPAKKLFLAGARLLPVGRGMAPAQNAPTRSDKPA